MNQESRKAGKEREPAATVATTNTLPFSCFPAFLIHSIRVPSVFICGIPNPRFIRVNLRRKNVTEVLAKCLDQRP
jgi:hypothetical protein